MACLMCFFDDDYQEHLRNVSQHSADKFEDVILEYKINFLHSFKKLTKVSECEKHKNLDKNMIIFLNEFYDYLAKIDISSRFDFFREVYLLWIKGYTEEAMDKLVKDELLLKKKIKTLGLFFKGRISEKYLAKEDLYHIPFNERYLMRKQRYNVSGIPVIYLSRSILGVFAELRHLDKNLSEVNISSFLLKPQYNDLKICDFSNGFGNLFDVLKGIFKSGANIKFDDVIEIYGIEVGCNWQKKTKEMFLNYIPILLCSFKKRYEDNEKDFFCEEYVLPQLIAEAARKKGYDGIQFQSTRINRDSAYIDDKSFSNRHKLNIALFTRYNENSIYDEDLLSKFIISKPIKIDEAEDISENNLEELKKEIVRIDNERGVFDTIEKLSEYAGISDNISVEKLKIKNSKTEFILYKDTSYGKLHYYMVYLNLLKMRNLIAASYKIGIKEKYLLFERFFR